MIKKFLPKTLLGRSTLILLIPLIGLQIIVTLIFYNRHWDTITRHRTINFAGDIALLVESFEKFDSLENQKWVLNNASSKLQLESKFKLEEKIEIITPLSVQSRGCQLSIRLRESIDNITENLHDRGVLSDWREPNVIRVAPVPLYNTFEDCFNFVRILKAILNEQR